MTFLTPLALIGLVLLPAIVLLSIRRPRPRRTDVSSLMLWLGLEGASRARRRSWHPPLLTLLLQLLAVALLVVGLARPGAVIHSAAPVTRLVVLDDSLAMTIRAEGRTQFAWARQALSTQLQRTPQARTTLILASAQPRVVLLRAPVGTVLQAVARLQPEMAPPDFADAFRLAAGFASPRMQPILVIRALQDTVPRLPGFALQTVAVGQSLDNQVLTKLTVDCTDGGTVCAGLAEVHNHAPFTVHDRVAILADGDVLAVRPLPLGPEALAEINFAVPAGQQVVAVQLQRPDILPEDNAAWSAVPGQRSARVTIVGKGSSATLLERAVKSLPAVSMQVLAPNRYSPSHTPWSDLLVLDGWPGGALPPAGAVLLVNPLKFPGGSESGPLADTTLTGARADSPLLAGVDLTSLDVPAGEAEQVQLPPGMTPLVWSAGGPLVAAGVLQGERVALLAFDPAHSDLPQLPAFPTFLANLTRWAQSWLPDEATVGDAVAIQSVPGTRAISISGPGTRRTLAPGAAFIPAAPGLYRIVERGPWGSREGELAADIFYAAAPQSVSTRTDTVSVAATGTFGSWWPSILLIALLIIAAELFVTSRRWFRS